MSADHRIMVEPKKQEKLSITRLPDDVLMDIFVKLDGPSLKQCCLTCKRWKSVINSSETIWKKQCLQMEDSEAKQYLLKSKAEGNSWKKSYQLNYGNNLIISKWRKGAFSNPKDLLELPLKVMCPMSADTWAEIFQTELERLHM